MIVIEGCRLETKSNNDLFKSMGTEAAALAKDEMWKLPPATLRKIAADMWQSPKVREAVDKDIDGVKTRFLEKPNPDFLAIHIHGGAFIMGSHDGQDVYLKEISDQNNCNVISIEYPLAPENPYPAGLDVCERVIQHILDNATKFGSKRVVLIGLSSGANFVASILLRLRKKNLHKRIESVVLYYGFFDLTPNTRTSSDSLMFSWERRTKSIEYYLQGRPAQYADISPRFGDLSGLPRALFLVGTKDILLDDSLFMHSKWEDSKIVIAPGADHAFNLFPGECTRKTNEIRNDFLKGLEV